jgi:hypothetical protein
VTHTASRLAWARTQLRVGSARRRRAGASRARGGRQDPCVAPRGQPRTRCPLPPPSLPWLTAIPGAAGSRLRHALPAGASTVQIRDKEPPVSCLELTPSPPCSGQAGRRAGPITRRGYRAGPIPETPASRRSEDPARRRRSYPRRRRGARRNRPSRLTVSTGLQIPAGAHPSALAFALLSRAVDAIPWVVPWLTRGLPRVVTGQAPGHGGTSSGRNFPARSGRTGGPVGSQGLP